VPAIVASLPAHVAGSALIAICVAQRELVAPLVVDRGRVNAAELVGEEGGHLALVEMRGRVIQPAREIDRDVTRAASYSKRFRRYERRRRRGTK
jgi:hypothetical protein